MIEFPKTINLIESRMNDLSKFRTKNWVEKKVNIRKTYNTKSQIKFKTTMLM